MQGWKFGLKVHASTCEFTQKKGIPCPKDQRSYKQFNPFSINCLRLEAWGKWAIGMFSALEHSTSCLRGTVADIFHKYDMSSISFICYSVRFANHRRPPVFCTSASHFMIGFLTSFEVWSIIFACPFQTSICARILQDRVLDIWRYLAGGILKASWKYFGSSWGHLGGHLGASWGHLGVILGSSWGILGSSWGILGLCWGILGSSWGILGAFWGSMLAYVGASWEHFGGLCWLMLGYVGLS